MSQSDKLFLPRIEAFLDCNGRLLQFELTQGPQTEGVLVRARQVNPEFSPGYEFSAWSALVALRSMAATSRSAGL